MALTGGDVALWAELARLNAIPPRPRVLEIGEANWYGDVEAPDDCKAVCLFQTARNWYRKVLNYRSIVAIDLHGRRALKLDLNEPLPMPPDVVFDIVINTGTAEHVFDQRRLFQTIHERAALNGLMVHAAPWQGWADHGFYSHQPCLYAELSRANGYEMLYGLAWAQGEADCAGQAVANVTFYVALKKLRDGPFKVPTQHRYDTN